MTALIPIFFGIQQAFEGRVWQLLGVDEADSAVPFALGFHFFSHFLWLWWIPLSSYVVEPGKVRKRVFLVITLLGCLAGGFVYFTLALNSDWLSVAVQGRSIVYDIASPYREAFRIGIPASAPYALIILIPLLFSSHHHLRIFGVLVALSALLASAVWGYAFVSVWCLFAAVLSLYLAFAARRLSSSSKIEGCVFTKRE